METLQFLLFPFLACVLLVMIHAYFGVHILERGIIFVDLALAQFIGVGIALAMLYEMDDSYLLPVAFAILGSVILAVARKLSHHVNVEAFIGVLYIFSLAASILILDKSPHGMEEFKNIMNGNILWVTPQEVGYTALIYGGIGLLHFMLRKQFLALSYEGKESFWLEILFFASFAMVLVKSVKLAGILQVFSFLVIPALVGRLFFKAPGGVMITGWCMGILISLTGMAVSFKLDIPTAPVIVAGMAASFFGLLLLKLVMKFGRQGQA